MRFFSSCECKLCPGWYTMLSRTDAASWAKENFQTGLLRQVKIKCATDKWTRCDQRLVHCASPMPEGWSPGQSYVEVAFHESSGISFLSVAFKLSTCIYTWKVAQWGIYLTNYLSEVTREVERNSLFLPCQICFIIKSFKNGKTEELLDFTLQNCRMGVERSMHKYTCRHIDQHNSNRKYLRILIKVSC